MPAPGPATAIASLLIIAVLGSMLGAWGWALRQIAIRQSLLPRVPPRWVPWGTGTILLIVLAWFVTLQVVTLAHYSLTGRSGKAESQLSQSDSKSAVDIGKNDRLPWTDRDVLIITDIVALLLIPQILVIVQRTSAATLGDLGLTVKDLPRNVARGIVGCLLLAPICYALIAVLSAIWTPKPHDLESMLRGQFTGTTAILAILSAVVLAPVVEELAFRGVVLPWLERLFVAVRSGSGQRSWESTAENPVASIPWKSNDSGDDHPLPGSLDTAVQRDGMTTEPWGWPALSGEVPATPVSSEDTRSINLARWMGNIVTSLIFAALHAPQWPAPVPLFVLSLGLGVLVQRTGSLVGPIALHATFNGLATAALILSQLLGDSLRAEKVETLVPPPAVVDTESIVPPPRSHQRISHIIHQIALGETRTNW